MIDHEIPVSSLELIRNKIAGILMDEYENQYYQFGQAICNNISWMQDRTVPIDKIETDMIEIAIFKGDDANYSYQGGQHLTYTYVLDIVTKAKSSPTKRGYQSAAERLQRHLMLLRYILMNPQYATLQLPGIVERTTVQKFQVYKDDRIGDASGIASAQMLFDVLCEEISDGNSGVLLAQSNTGVFIELTDRGYQYQKP